MHKVMVNQLLHFLILLYNSYLLTKTQSLIISNGDRSFIYFNEGVIDGKYDAKLCEAALVIIIISNQELHSTL